MKRRRFSGRRHRKSAAATLKITSMMDILTVLLLFLLKSFVADGEIVTPAPGIALPTSESRDALEESVVIAVQGDRISVSGEVLAQWPGDFSADTAAAHQALGALADYLQTARSRHESLAAQRGADATRSKVTIQGDRALPFALLEQVMLTCSESGYDDIALAVLQG